MQTYNNSDPALLFFSLLIWTLILIVIIAKVRRELRSTNHRQSPSIPNHELAQLQAVKSVPQEYHYERRDLIMTRTETEFFKMLDEAIGSKYYVFPQVHLSSILEHRIDGQDWWKAFHHLNRKSVDFVICERNKVQPLVAIELDDWSHKLEKRKLRDAEVERIFRGANFPLLRFGYKGPYTAQSIAQSIAATGVLKT